MQINWMTAAVLGVIALFALSGLHRGLIGKLNGILSLLLAALLVWSLLPVTTRIIKSRTPIYPLIERKCEETISQAVEKVYEEIGNGKSVFSIDRDTVSYYMDMYGMDSSGVYSMSDGDLKDLVELYFPDLMPQGAVTALSDLTRIEQTELIQNLPIPGFLQRMMLNYNNSEGYGKLGASDFQEYLVGFFSGMILNLVALIVTLIISWMIIWSVMAVLGLFVRLPLVRTADRMGGLVLGLIQGVLVVWIAFCVIAMFSGTSWGMELQEMIDESVILKPLYESNFFMKLIMRGLSSIM